MKVKRLYRKLLSVGYKLFFAGPCHSLEVTGLISFQNRKSIHIGNNVLIKRGTMLLPNGNEGSIVLADSCEIHEYSVLRTFGGYIHIGARSSLNMFGMIWGAGGVKIGHDVRIGPRVNIATNNHVFKDRSRLIIDQGVTFAPVEIGDDVWIGVNVTILPGVRIGRGSVVGAGSVITKDVEDYSVVVGVPARKIANR
jgi:acetyltransferase-like isoleucine patch superfamily enzyme